MSKKAKLYIISAIVIILIILIIIFFILFSKRTKELSIRVLQENFYYVAEMKNGENTPSINIMILSNLKFKTDEIKNIDFFELNGENINISKISILEHNNQYLYTFNFNLIMTESKIYEITKLSFNLFEKSYEFFIGNRVIEILDSEEFSNKNIMNGPIFFQTYNAITLPSDTYVIFLGNNTMDDFIIEQIGFMNSEISLTEFYQDNQKVDKINIAPGQVTRITLKFKLLDGYSLYTITPQIYYTHKNISYNQLLPAAYNGHLDLNYLIDNRVN